MAANRVEQVAWTAIGTVVGLVLAEMLKDLLRQRGFWPMHHADTDPIP